MDIKMLFYIIFGIIVLIIRYIRQQKKEIEREYPLPPIQQFDDDKYESNDTEYNSFVKETFNEDVDLPPLPAKRSVQEDDTFSSVSMAEEIVLKRKMKLDLKKAVIYSEILNKKY